MPTYEYKCRHCGREFEVFQRMSDTPGAPCPDCGHGAERLISGGAGLLFKGDGFYITDYRSDDYRKQAREEAGVGAGKGGDTKDDKGTKEGTSDPKTADAAPKSASPSEKRSTGTDG